MHIKFLKFIFFLGLLNIPSSIGNTYLHFLFDLIFLIAFFSVLQNNKLILFKPHYTKHLRYVYLYLILMFISYIRASEFNFLNILNFTSFTLFILAYLSLILVESSTNEKKILDNFTNFIMAPFIWWFALNIICWMLNLTSSHKELTENSIGNAVVLSNFGIYIERVNFLFSKGINGYAVVVGAFFTYFSILILTMRNWSIFNIISISILFITILLTDARSAIAYPILIGIIIYLVRIFKFGVILRFSSILLIIIPLIIVSSLPLLSKIEFFNQFSRSDSDFFTLNGRLFIWFFALDEFLSFKLIHLFGYGLGGHVTSEVSQNWAFLFVSYHNPNNVHPHNSILSILFDIGYVGLITILIIFNQVSKKLLILYKHNQKETLTLFSILLYFIFISVSESFLTNLYMNSFVIFLSFFIFILISIDNTSIKQSDDLTNAG
jgi:O-antigen ligase